VEQRLAQCRGGLQRHVGVIHVIASPSGGGDFIPVPGVCLFREGRGLELAIGGSPRPRGSAGDTFSNSARRPRRFQGAKGPALPRRPRRPEEHGPSPRHLFNDSDRPDRDSLKRCPSRARLTTPALTPNAPQGADLGATPRRLQSLIIWGGGALNVHVSLPVGGGQGPAFDVAEVGRTTPEMLRERSC
jgi:hypothetical protein